MKNQTSLYSTAVMDGLLDKLSEVLRQRDAAIRLGLAATPDAFAELYAMKAEITRQNAEKNLKPAVTDAKQRPSKLKR